MHPAPSVILFTVLSGLGFGLMAHLALIPPAPGLAAFLHWALAFGLATAGLVASTFHLGRPERALKAFSQWRTSWLSREGVAAVATLAALAPVALSDIFGWPLRWPLALPGAGLAVASVVCTAMIYAQLRAVPRWNSALTPALFLLFAATGGAILTAAPWAPVLTLALGLLQAAAFRLGDGAFARAGQTTGSATGLAPMGRVQSFEWPHTGDTWLLREMIHVVGRRHAAKLRLIALGLAALVPALILLALPADPLAAALAGLCHLAGALAARWLFFAEAEHVVGLYYGRR
jgi:DMSO reductase anchor subunit